MTGPAARPGRDAFSERRKCLQRLLVLPGSLLFHEQASAGGQLEEPLADSVRSALSSAIANSAPPVPTFATTEARLSYLRWLSAMSDRLYSRKRDFNTRIEFLQTVWYETRRAGLDTSLVLGLIQVESAFRKFAVSSVGARGYMQVMPFWTRVIGDGDLVALHVHSTMNADDRGSAIVDIFRFDVNGKIVEHWDVIQPIPEKTASGNGLF